MMPEGDVQFGPQGAFIFTDTTDLSPAERRFAAIETLVSVCLNIAVPASMQVHGVSEHRYRMTMLSALAHITSKEDVARAVAEYHKLKRDLEPEVRKRDAGREGLN